MFVLAPLTLTVIVAFLVHSQNQRVLAWQADKALQAMQQAGDVLDGMAQEVALPENQHRRAKVLAREYPRGHQLRVFAESLLADLRRANRHSSR
ncbi:hypothetical protein [Luteimonas sp. A478]